jgi:hypothetical protein
MVVRKFLWRLCADLFIYILLNSLGPRPFWETNSSPVSEEMPHVLWNLKFITVFAIPRLWSCSELDEPSQRPRCLRSILVFSHLRLDLVTYRFLSCFLRTTYTCGWIWSWLVLGIIIDVVIEKPIAIIVIWTQEVLVLYFWHWYNDSIFYCLHPVVYHWLSTKSMSK